MPSSTSSSSLSPGALLAGRYRIEDHVVDVATTSYWRAVDETLGRDVGVRTVSAEDPLAATLTAAARTAASSHDPRFLRVLDVSTDRGQVFVVSEWARGHSLEELLAAGPLPDRDALHLAHEVAEALATAHRQNLWHRCLRPACVVVTDVGQVKLVGLTVDAVVAGLPDVDPAQAALEDAAGCGRLLFAALTGRWPTNGSDAHAAVPMSDLPPPDDDGRVASPRQVRGGIPAALDTVTVRALGRPTHRQGPLLTPAAVAAALDHVELPHPPAAADPAFGPTYDGPASVPTDRPVAAPAAPGDKPRDGRDNGWFGWSLAVVLVVGLALLGWAIVITVSGSVNDGAPATGDTPASSPATGPATGAPIAIAEVRDFDPQGNGEENRDELPRAVDGDPATAWTTMTYYNRANLGGLKDGVGLLVDLGSPQKFASVSLDLVGRGTGVALRVGDTPPRSADELTEVASLAEAGPQATLRPDSPVTARYLLVWLTKLPSVGGSDYRGGIAEVVVHR